MAHFCLLVFSATPDREQIAGVLRPYWDSDADEPPSPHFVFVEDSHADSGPRHPVTGRFGYWKNPIGQWDGWVIGGRWSGLLGPSYDPDGDAEAGPGPGNQQPARTVAALIETDPARFGNVYALLADGRWRDADEFRASGGRDWPAEVLSALRGADPEAWVTVVDCHC